MNKRVLFGEVTGKNIQRPTFSSFSFFLSFFPALGILEAARLAPSLEDDRISIKIEK